jgi:PPM family protein phosphatase
MVQPANTARSGDSEFRDHLEWVAGRYFAAVTNRGRIHTTNEDYAAIVEVDLGSSKAQVIVVCDGVSSAQNSEIASKKGATAAADSLIRLLKAKVEAKDAMRLSISVADMAVRKIPIDPDSQLHPPGATIAAAVMHKGLLTVGWIGDSRCYWIDKNGVQLLTHDHSWVNMVVSAGTISQEHAEKQPEAHRIFRCIGPIFAAKTSEEQPVEVRQVKVTPPGRLLVCTDGFWNYLSSPEVLQKLVTVGQGTPDALTQARSLVDFACSQGGKDNVTVAILAVN